MVAISACHIELRVQSAGAAAIQSPLRPGFVPLVPPHRKTVSATTLCRFELPTLSVRFRWIFVCLGHQDSAPGLGPKSKDDALETTCSDLSYKIGDILLSNYRLLIASSYAAVMGP